MPAGMLQTSPGTLYSLRRPERAVAILIENDAVLTRRRVVFLRRPAVDGRRWRRPRCDHAEIGPLDLPRPIH